MEAIILAGGRGTRLGTLLKGIPKPMVPIGNKPFLEILMERLLASGCARTILSVGFLQSVIRDHFGVTYKSMVLDYVTEDEPLGTGGAIRRALTATTERNVIVLNGDTFLQLNYEELLNAHASCGAELSIAVVEQEDISRFGGLIIEGNRVVSFCEKGRSGRGWINGGVYALRSDIVWPGNLPHKFSFESDFLMKQVESLKPLAFKCSGYFLDIGVPDDLDRAQRDLVS